jgi:hypothetical protein
MSSARGRIGSALLAGLALACAGSNAPTFAETGGSLPALADGSGRIVLYMTDSVEVPAFRPEIALDGTLVAVIRAGTYVLLDRPAGLHELGVHARKADFGEQGATEPLAVALAPDETVYVRVDVRDAAGMVIPELTRETAEDGRRDMGRLRRIEAAPPPS